MKFHAKHFKFHTKSRRFKMSVWKKYFDLKKKTKLTEFDKFWIRQLRAQLKTNQFKLVGIHVPTKTQTEWTLKKDLSKEKINRKEYLNGLLMKVKENRKALKQIKKTAKVFEGARYNTIGNVFEVPNQINPLSAQLTINDPYAQKVPRRKDKNYIGIELEFNQIAGVGQDQIAGALKNAGLARYVDVATDGSCGWEVRVLLTEDDFVAPLTKIMSVLHGMGFPTNEKCGTHVHFDMRNRDIKVVYQNLFKTQKFLRKFLTRNRKYNTFCKMNKADTFEKQLSLGDRYYSLNVEAYRRHKTIEVRMHQGTLKSDELIPWINLLIKVMNYNSALAEPVNTLKQAKKQFDIDAELAQNLENKLLTVFNRKDKVAAPDVIPATRRRAGFILNPF